MATPEERREWLKAKQAANFKMAEAEEVSSDWIDEQIELERAGEKDKFDEASKESWEKGVNPKDLIGSKKLPLSLVPPTADMGLALAMKEGAIKYGPYNWRDIPIQYTIYLEACLGHLKALIDGEDVDPDSGLWHVYKAQACLAIIADAHLSNTLIDNRHSNKRLHKGGFSRDPYKAFGDPEKIKWLLEQPVRDNSIGSTQTDRVNTTDEKQESVISTSTWGCALYAVGYQNGGIEDVFICYLSFSSRPESTMYLLRVQNHDMVIDFTKDHTKAWIRSTGHGLEVAQESAHFLESQIWPSHGWSKPEPKPGSPSPDSSSSPSPSPCWYCPLIYGEDEDIYLGTIAFSSKPGGGSYLLPIYGFHPPGSRGNYILELSIELNSTGIWNAYIDPRFMSLERARDVYSTSIEGKIHPVHGSDGNSEGS